MCTVSIVPVDQGFRLVCNRDERKTRPAARPPMVTVTSGGHALFPVDPVSGGTWIGANDAGLAMALLNRNGSRRRPSGGPRRSRGGVVPRLLQYGSIDRVIHAAVGFEYEAFEPFQWVAAQGGIVAVGASDGCRLTVDMLRLDRPRLFTSSSLGDDLVDGPRRRLFSTMVVERPDGPASWLEGQFLFHRHRWADRPDISVWMHREDAATVSRTSIDVGRAGVGLEYEALGGPARGA